jgi:hypothetical protein
MTDNRNEFFDKLSQSLSGINGQLQVMESNVPVEKQLEFFKLVNSLKSRDLPPVEEQIELLGKPELTVEETNVILASLAISCDVKAFRALEKFRELNPGHFTNMACMQAKMMLQSEFSDKRIVFISTGLGGKDDKLRYTALFKSNRKKIFSGYQRNLIENEIPYYINRHGGEVEEIELGDNYFTVVFLQEFNGDLKTLLENAICECNQYGDFIDNTFIVSNVKRFTKEDIERELHIKNEKRISNPDI